MQTLLTFFVLLFSSSMFADDITDLQIEGISIGDSLLDYYSESEINDPERLKNSFNYNNKFLQLGFYENLSTYYKVSVIIKQNQKNYVTKKNGNKYLIYGLRGTLYFDYFEECYEKKDQIVLELSSFFNSKNYEKYIYNDQSHSYDIKSKVSKVEFLFDNGGVCVVSCTDWSLELEKTMNFVDDLTVELKSPELIDFLNNDFYK